MLDLYELKQLSAFAELGTLARVAEEFHISTPSVTRSMQHVEEAFAVPLFTRSKNKIQLNETGKVAAEQARRLLEETERAVDQVRAFDARQHTLAVRSCAPAPLWELLPRLNAKWPHMTVSAAICQNDEVLSAWHEGSCDVAVLPFQPPDVPARPFLRERLFVCVPSDHQLAQGEGLTFGDINGFNFLLRTQLGFWDALCREKMPASKFLVQTEESVFDELVRASSLPCFTTDYFLNRNAGYPGRVNIPLTDPEADVTFYVLWREKLSNSAPGL